MRGGVSTKEQLISLGFLRGSFRKCERKNTCKLHVEKVIFDSKGRRQEFFRIFSFLKRELASEFMSPLREYQTRLFWKFARKFLCVVGKSSTGSKPVHLVNWKHKESNFLWNSSTLPFVKAKLMKNEHCAVEIFEWNQFALNIVIFCWIYWTGPTTLYVKNLINRWSHNENIVIS